MKVIYRLFKFIYKIQQWWFKHLTPNGLAILICLFAAVIIGIDTKQTMAYQIIAFLLAVLLVAIAFSFYFPYRFSVKRNLPKFVTVGVTFSYRLTITNQTKKEEKGLLLIEEIASPKYSFTRFRQTLQSSRHRKTSLIQGYLVWLKAIARERRAVTKVIPLPSLPPLSETEIKGSITPTHRGVIRLSGISMLRPDPFNIFYARKTINLPQSLLVLPRRYQLPPFILPGARMSQSGTVSLASSVGDSEEFVSLREYRPGDPWRKIHWKSWAKLDKPVVREEQSEYFVRHALILDTFQPEAESEILEEAISVAASFACDFHTQESLLDLMFVGLESYCFTSGRGLGSSEQMLEVLAGVRACRDQDFACLTAAVMERLSLLSGCICVFITWDESRKQLVQRLQESKIPLLILLLAESETASNQLHIENLYILPLGQVQESLAAIALVNQSKSNS